MASTIPLDKTGKLSSNKISNEKHYLTIANGTDRRMIVPVYAPFFGNSVALEGKSASGQWTLLRKDYDYAPVFELQDISDTVDSPLYSAIVIMDDSVWSSVRVTYQTIGSDLVANRQATYTSLVNKILAGRSIRWNQITNPPRFYAVSQHTHSLIDDFVGFASIASTIANLAGANTAEVYESDLASIVTHINSNNPSPTAHSLTKAQIGLPNVPNFPIATVSEAVDPANRFTLLTPATASAVAKTNLKSADETNLGIAQLNLGNKSTDGTNNTDALTPKGLLTLLKSNNGLNLQAALGGGRNAVKISIWPLPASWYWKGVRYTDQKKFFDMISTYADVNDLYIDLDTGVVSFPFYFLDDTPDLTISTSLGNIIYTPFDTQAPMGVPMLYAKDLTGQTVITYRDWSVDDTVDTPLTVQVVTQY